MAVTSGTSANVSLKANDAATSATAVINATGWTLDRTAVEGAYACNSTGGNRRRVSGTKDATGTISGVYDPATPIEAVMQVGDRVYLQLHLTSTIGSKLYARITAGPSYAGDIEEGQPSRWTYNWAQDDNSPTWNTTVIAPS